MARKRKRDWPVIVFSYGVLPSFQKEGPPRWMVNEAFIMNALWNDLVEIGRRYLETYQLNLDQDPRLATYAEKRDALIKEIDLLNENIKKLRQKLRTKKHPEIDLLKQKKAQLQEELKEVKKIYSQEKEKVKKEHKDIWERMEKEVKEKIDEYKDILYWANLGAVKDRFWTAWRKVKNGTPPKFHRFDGNWTLTWHFGGGGLPVEKILERKWKGSGKPILDRIPPDWVYDLPSRKRARNANVKVFLEAGMKGDKKVEISIIMHRPLPQKGFLKKITVVRKKHGLDMAKYFVNFTVEVPPEDYKVPVPEKRKPCAVMEVGFRKVGETEIEMLMPTEKGKVRVKRLAEIIRVGVLYDGEKFEEIYLPEKITAKWFAAADKQAKADRILQELKNDLWNFFKEEGVIEKLPEEVKEEIKKLFSNKAAWGKVRKRGLLKLVDFLEKGKLFEDVVSEIHDVLQEWIRLVSIVSRMKKKALGYRKKFYENLAVRLFNEYERVVVAQIDLKKLSEKDMAETLPEKARTQRTLAGISEFLDILEKRAQRTGSLFEKKKIQYKTRTCHLCGKVVEPDDPSKIEWVCNNCGAKWDQDYNAAVNLWNSTMAEIG